MGNIASDETKKIPIERWGEWCDTFSNGNRGRPVNITLVDDELGAEPLTEGAAFAAIDYDPVGKGNDFVISFGDDPMAPSHHTVAAPVALWQGQDENGLVVSLEIKDEGERNTVITFV